MPHSLEAQDHEAFSPLDIAPVWSGHRVGFDMVTTNSAQYVAFYDADQWMTIARRNLDEDQWQFTELPSRVGWDSHNYIEMALDDSGYIHISGNMHVDPLVYFRSVQPCSIDSFETPGMVGTLEDRVTYPKFFEDPDGNLIFQYRIGGSGNGNTIWNRYDLKTKTWTRLTEKGLFDGEGDVNAYHSEPKLGPDGYFHMVWMWRDTPVANTNHHLSHMKSKDLVHWETMAGAPVKIPVTRSTPGVVVDSTGPGNGLINVGHSIGWNKHGEGIITYHKYGEKGYDQIFNARWANDRWNIRQTSKWTSYRFDLERTGSLDFGIVASPVRVDTRGRLVQTWHHNEFGEGTWVLHNETLEILEAWPPERSEKMDQLRLSESGVPGMEVRLLMKDGWCLRWESLPANQDKPRPQPWPEPSMLRIFQIE